VSAAIFLTFLVWASHVREDELSLSSRATTALVERKEQYQRRKTQS